MQKLASLVVGSFLLVGGCVSTPPRSSSAGADRPSYEERFDPWRASNRALEPASHGDRDALIAFFLSGYVRASEPYTGGEDLEQMVGNYKHLLETLGDKAFADALRQQRPEVRSAARAFIVAATLRVYPETSALLRTAPEIDWPFEKAGRGS